MPKPYKSKAFVDEVALEHYLSALGNIWMKGHKTLADARSAQMAGSTLDSTLKYNLEFAVVSSLFPKQLAEIEERVIPIGDETENRHINALIAYDKALREAYAGEGMSVEDYYSLRKSLDLLVFYGVTPEEHVRVECGICKLPPIAGQFYEL